MGETVEFENVVCTRDTDAALLCEIDGAEHWIPRSQISPESEVDAAGDEGTLVVTEWIAAQRGLV